MPKWNFQCCQGLARSLQEVRPRIGHLAAGYVDPVRILCLWALALCPAVQGYAAPLEPTGGLSKGAAQSGAFVSQVNGSPELSPSQGAVLPPPARPPVLRAGEVCLTGECGPALSKVVYLGHEAYKLTDGRTEAVVVPKLGRVMSYGLKDGPNLLWNAIPGAEPKYGSWVNYGGDKTWLGPQSFWRIWHGRSNWPPDPNIDGQSGSKAEVVTGGKLRLTYPLSPSTGIQLVREISIDASGQLVIEQTATKHHGVPLLASLWSVTQVVPGQAIYVPLNANSPYKKNFHWIQVPKGVVAADPVGHNLLRLQPELGGSSFKIGVDSLVSSLVSVRDQVAFLQHSSRPKGEYPDGAEGAGFPVEVFMSTEARAYYAELEVLSPLLRFEKGSRWKHTVYWSLHALPSADLESAATLATLETLIHGPVSSSS